MEISELNIDSARLPKIPVVMQRLIASFNNEDVDISELVDQISLDPVITAKLLRVVNSPLYGGQRDITTVREAIVRLGIKSLRSLVMAAALATAFRTPADFDIRAFWRQSFRLATLCQWLATQSRSADIDTEIAFSCAMMSKIGVLLIHDLYPREAETIETLVSHGGSRLQVEQTQLGHNHCDIAAGLAQHWDFPPLYQQGLKFQLQPDLAEPFNLYAALISLSIQLDDAMQGQAEDDDCGPLLDSLAVQYPQQLQLNSQTMSAGWAVLFGRLQHDPML